jgi:hypothetical protein
VLAAIAAVVPLTLKTRGVPLSLSHAQQARVTARREGPLHSRALARLGSSLSPRQDSARASTGLMAWGRGAANQMLSSSAPAAAAPFVVPKSVPTGAGEVVFEFHDPASRRARPMRVFAYFPEVVQNGEPTNVLFVMHGVNRNAEETFRRIAPAHRNPLDAEALLPEKHNFVLLVPEFSAELFPGRNAYNFGNVFQVRPLQECACPCDQLSLRADALAHAQACLRAHVWAFVPLQGEDPSRPNPREVWSFSVIERIFGAIKSVGKLNAAGYVLFGHSAGAQFVHRLIAFASRASANGTEQGHLLRAVAANAGSYTLPTFEERFPFGFGGLEALFSQEDLSAFVSAPLTVLLGQEDTGKSCRLHAFPSGCAHAACCDFSDSSAACIHQIPTTSTCQQTRLRSGKGHTGWRAGIFSSTRPSTTRTPSERPVAGVCKRSPGWATVEPGCCLVALPPVSCSRRTTGQSYRLRPVDTGAS